VSGYASVQQVISAVSTQQQVEVRATGRTQHVLLALVRAVRNIRDEHDVQCLAFLAGELGLLRHTPFCFSRAVSRDRFAPESLILRDTFRVMLNRRLIGWENGSLRALVEDNASSADHERLHDGISWLGALQPRERHVLTQATIDLHDSGSNLLSSSADLPFRKIVASMLDGGNEATAAERRLSMVRRQLSIA
jgi:hypothetical protein